MDRVGEPVHALLNGGLVDHGRGPAILRRHSFGFVEDLVRVERRVPFRRHDERRENVVDVGLTIRVLGEKREVRVDRARPKHVERPETDVEHDARCLRRIQDPPNRSDVSVRNR